MLSGDGQYRGCSGKAAYSGDPFNLPLSCRLYMVDGLGYRYPHLVVESPHDGAGINVAGIPRRNDPATVFTVAQQQGLMTLGLAGLGSPEQRLFQCPIGKMSGSTAQVSMKFTAR